MHARRPQTTILLDMDSSVSETHGVQEGSAYNGHFACTCYHPLFVFNQFGDLERCALRQGDVHSADGWRAVLEPVVTRYRSKMKCRYFRGDAAYANPAIYEFLDAEGYKYTIRLPANSVLQERTGWLRKRPIGRPPNEVRRYYTSFSYQAASWSKPRRVVAKVEWHPGQFYPRFGFIVTNMTRPVERVVMFYNQRGTAEQHIKEGKNAVIWTRLSCRRFAANAVRLQLHALAYNLATFLRTLTMPDEVKHWLVADHAARPTGQDRRQDRQARPIDRLPDGRSDGAARCSDISSPRLPRCGPRRQSDVEPRHGRGPLGFGPGEVCPDERRGPLQELRRGLCRGEPSRGRPHHAVFLRSELLGVRQCGSFHIQAADRPGNWEMLAKAGWGGWPVLKIRRFELVRRPYVGHGKVGLGSRELGSRLRVPRVQARLRRPPMRITVLALTAVFLAPTALLASTGGGQLVRGSELAAAELVAQERQTVSHGVAVDQRGRFEGNLILAKGDQSGTGPGVGGQRGQKKGGHHGHQKEGKDNKDKG